MRFLVGNPRWLWGVVRNATPAIIDQWSAPPTPLVGLFCFKGCHGFSSSCSVLAKVIAGGHFWTEMTLFALELNHLGKEINSW